MKSGKDPLTHYPRVALPDKYREWRDAFIDPKTDILEGIEHLTDAQLRDAYQAALPGVIAERLHPRSAQFDGSFHLAMGIIIGTMSKRGLYVGINIPNCI